MPGVLEITELQVIHEPLSTNLLGHRTSHHSLWLLFRDPQSFLPGRGMWENPSESMQWGLDFGALRLGL